jgi:hypothetical protein
MTIDCIEEVLGAVELRDWFGSFPSFHDANMRLQIDSGGTGWLKAYGFRMTSEVDKNGYFVCDKHFACTFSFDGIKSFSAADFQPGLAILGQLDIRKSGSAYQVDWDTAYGLSGSLICNDIRLTFEPGVKAP